jgi:hypothetical protein
LSIGRKISRSFFKPLIYSKKSPTSGANIIDATYTLAKMIVVNASPVVAFNRKLH